MIPFWEVPDDPGQVVQSGRYRFKPVGVRSVSSS